MAPASSKEFLDIQATIECGFTLKLVRDMIKTYNGQLCYKASRPVVADKNRQVDIIHDIHEGLGNTSHSETMSAHLERTPTYKKNAARFFWYGIYNYVGDCIHKCDRCQRQRSLLPNAKNEINSVPVSCQVMKQLGSDFCSFSEVNGYHYFIACIEYFTKWSQTKPIRDKTALTETTFFTSLCVVMVA